MKVKFVVGLMLILLLTGCGNQAATPESKESSIYQVTNVKNCRITAPTADVKTGAGNSFDTIQTLNKGEVVKVLGQVGDWYVVQLDNNRVGCVNSASTEPVVKEGDLAREPQVTRDPQVPDIQQVEPVPAPAPAPTPNRTVDPTPTPTPNRTVDPTPAPAPGPAPTPGAETPAGTDLVGQENRMIELVNAARRQNSLPPLAVDPELTRAARIKSQDMVDNDYFSHYSPTYGSPFDMMRSLGIEYLTAGENLALNSSVDRAHEGLMNSAGHRKNILNPNFTHIGIGVKSKNRNSFLYTQMFIGKPE